MAFNVPLKTYSRKQRRDSVDAVDALFAENICKRKVAASIDKKRGKKGSIVIKDLPPPDANHHLMKDSFNGSLGLDDTFDRLRKDFVHQNVSVKRSSSARNNASNLSKSFLSVRRISQKPDELNVKRDKTLDKSVNISLFVERVPFHKRPEISTLSDSSLSQQYVLHKSRAHSTSDLCQEMFSRTCKDQIIKLHAPSRPVRACSTPSNLLCTVDASISPIPKNDQDKSLIEESYQEIKEWNFKPPNFPVPSYSSTPKIKSKSSSYKVIIQRVAKGNIKKLYREKSRNQSICLKEDHKLKIQPQVTLNRSIDVMGITHSFDMSSLQSIKETQVNNSCNSIKLTNTTSEDLNVRSSSRPNFITLRRRVVIASKPKQPKSDNINRSEVISSFPDPLSKESHMLEKNLAMNILPESQLVENNENGDDLEKIEKPLDSLNVNGNIIFKDFNDYENQTNSLIKIVEEDSPVQTESNINSLELENTSRTNNSTSQLNNSQLIKSAGVPSKQLNTKFDSPPCFITLRSRRVFKPVQRRLQLDSINKLTSSVTDSQVFEKIEDDENDDNLKSEGISSDSLNKDEDTTSKDSSTKNVSDYTLPKSYVHENQINLSVNVVEDCKVVNENTINSLENMRSSENPNKNSLSIDSREIMKFHNYSKTMDDVEPIILSDDDDEFSDIEIFERNSGNDNVKLRTEKFPNISPLSNNVTNLKNSCNGNLQSPCCSFNSESFCCKKLDSTPKPLILKPGKLWRRSLMDIKKDFQDSQKRGVCLATIGCNCTCLKCYHRSKLRFTELNRRMSVKIVPECSRIPLTDSNTTILEDYATCRLNTVVQEESVGSQRIVRTRKRSTHEPQSVVVNNPSVTARDIVLQRCGQTEPIPFSKCYPPSTLRNCFKIGEGVYGEVFLFRNAVGTSSVMKVIPIEGKQTVNGEHQKKFEEILSEVIISAELSNLRNNTANNTSGFVEVQRIRCVQGCYPDRLIELWEIYDESHNSENDSPEIFKEDQLYIILELANAGQDMEAFIFTDSLQTYSLFKQIACSLAVAEASFQFEHRDLHWGNILISQTDEVKQLRFCLNGQYIEIPTYGIKGSIIDYTLSRITHDGVCIFNDLGLDPDLFSAKGDYQFEIYRKMQTKNGNEWQHFEPYTNILWLHYVLTKMIRGVHYDVKSRRLHKDGMSKLGYLRYKILKYNSAKDLVLNEFL